MLKRCYSTKLSEYYPSYSNCFVSENFKIFSYFYDWCQKQVGFGEDGYDLDKDLLKKGNREYHEDKCVFIPSEINKSLTKSDSIRGVLPLGVCFHKQSNRYRSQIRIKGKQIDIGYFQSKTEAFNAYKIKKEEYLKNLADKYYNSIDIRAYQSLIRYKIDIND